MSGHGCQMLGRACRIAEPRASGERSRGCLRDRRSRPRRFSEVACSGRWCGPAFLRGRSRVEARRRDSGPACAASSARILSCNATSPLPAPSEKPGVRAPAGRARRQKAVRRETSRGSWVLPEGNGKSFRLCRRNGEARCDRSRRTVGQEPFAPLGKRRIGWQRGNLAPDLFNFRDFV